MVNGCYCQENWSVIWLPDLIFLWSLSQRIPSYCCCWMPSFWLLSHYPIAQYVTLLVIECLNQRIRQILGKSYLLSSLFILVKSQKQGQKSFINTESYMLTEPKGKSMKLINPEKFWFLSHFMNKLGKTLHGIQSCFPARTVAPSSKVILQPKPQKEWRFGALRHVSWHIVHKEQMPMILCYIYIFLYVNLHLTTY